MKNARLKLGKVVEKIKGGRAYRFLVSKLPRNWHSSVGAWAVLGLLTFVLVYALSMIPEQASSLEVINTSTFSSWRNILENPLFAPYKLASLAVLQFSESVRALRAISLVVFVVCGVSIFSLIKRWHSSRVAILTLLLFATNAIVLSVARLGDPLIMLFSWSVIVSLLLRFEHGRSKQYTPLLLALAGLLLFYVPGAPYVFLLLLILFFNKLSGFFKLASNNALIIGGAIATIGLAPLIYAFVKDTSLILEWLLLPDSIAPAQILRDTLAVPSSFFYQFRNDPLITVGRLPVLDIASGGLFLLGAYSYYKNYKLERTKVVLLAGLLAILLGALGEVRYGVAIFLPCAFAVIGAGLAYLLDIWYQIFPRNPFARFFAFLIISLVVTSSAAYQFKKFFVVSDTPETREVYNQARLVE